MSSRVRSRLGVLVTLALAVVIVVAVVAGDGGRGDGRVREITQRLRCPVCQAESVADSPSTTSRAMTRLVRAQVRAGRSDQQILAFFRHRYGDWILLDPPRSGNTLLLWLLPPAALAAGVVVVMRARTARPAIAEAATLTRSARSAPGESHLRLPWDGPSPRVVGVAVMAGALVVATLLVVRQTAPRAALRTVTGSGPSSSNVDLSNVATADLRAAVDANPRIVPMRLALVERLLRDGDVTSAHAQARTALQQATTISDRQRALTLAGWTTALIGSPKEGATLLEAGRVLAPTDRNTEWFLANVRLDGLHDPSGAIPLLEDLLSTTSDSTRRAEITARLATARQQLATGSGS